MSERLVYVNLICKINYKTHIKDGRNPRYTNVLHVLVKETIGIQTSTKVQTLRAEKREFDRLLTYCQFEIYFRVDLSHFRNIIAYFLIS